MDWYSFGLLLYDNLTLYISILVGSLALYFVLFRKSYISFLDPFIFNLLYSVFGFSVVIFLYATNSIEDKYLYSYLLTQIAFFAGLFLFKPLSRNDLITYKKTPVKLEDEQLFMKVLLGVTSVTYVIVQLLSYKLVGIPLFMESRTGAYAGSGGLGALGHIIDVLRPAVTFLVIYFFLQPGKSFLMTTFLLLNTLFVLLSFALSGSKSLFMSLGFILFIYLLMNAGQLKQHFSNLRKYEGYVILFGLVFVFLTIFVQLGNSNPAGDSSINIFLYRLVASGDAYYFAYPDHVIETINGSKGFLALFGEVFSTVRLVPREAQPEILGLQLFQYYYDGDIITGPNARQNVFGYVYYGFWGSIVFSFTIGVALSWLRNKLMYKFSNSVLGQMIFMFLYINYTFVETDPPVAVSGVTNAALILPVFLLIAFVLYLALYRFKNLKLHTATV